MGEATVNEHIDLYCERIGANLLAEPVNLLTNLSFIIAASIHIRHYFALKVNNKVNQYSYLYLIILVFLIGIGSSLFHSFATKWAMLADVIPIGIYLISFLPIYISVCGDFQSKHTLTLLAYFGFTTFLGSRVPPTLANGSQNYFGALITLVSLGLLSKIRGHSGFSLLLAAGGALCLSLFFRSIDQLICPILPLGTHFLWHIFNGIVLYLTLEFVRIQLRNDNC